MENYFNQFDWNKMMSLHKPSDYDIAAYHRLLSPELPAFLDKYLELPILTRLKGIGLLCGTDWTNLYNNRFYYSRYQHSLGVALIIWHFTHNKAQTIAGLLHDVSTPVFSHVGDFRLGDALTQTSTEALNANFIGADKELLSCLAKDELLVEQVNNYHNYPIADNEIPQLSADRLEYMFPSGMALDGSWDLHSIKVCYNDLVIAQNEFNSTELAFQTYEIAEEYCRRFCLIGHILQLNENKLALHLLGHILNLALQKAILQESDFMKLSEREIFEKIEAHHRELGNVHDDFGIYRLYRTFRKMTKIEHTDAPLDEKKYFSVSLSVKQRYINPLVLIDAKAVRLDTVSKQAKKYIEDFLAYKDTAYGCVEIIDD